MSAPVDARWSGLASVAMRDLDQQLNAPGMLRTVGVVILIFPYAEPDGRGLHYIANGANRDDIRRMFNEMTARFEGKRA